MRENRDASGEGGIVAFPGGIGKFKLRIGVSSCGSGFPRIRGRIDDVAESDSLGLD